MAAGDEPAEAAHPQAAMGDILFQYDRVNPTTWAYLSSLLTFALFFKFSRLWALRNLDLVLVILLAPGLLCVKYGLDAAGADGAATIENLGYIWLFSINGLLLVRMLLDSVMVRRPLLEANLTADALAFLAGSLLLFLTANVITGAAERADLFAAKRAEHLSKLESSRLEQSTLDTHGPGFTLVFFLPHISTQTLLGDAPADDDTLAPGVADDGVADDGASDDGAADDGGADDGDDDAAIGESPPRYSGANVVTARVVAILSQLFIVLGLVLIGLWHFENVRMGIAAATLYLLLPYTAMWTGSVTHALPGALLVWAVLLYRQPLLSGALMGLLVGTIYYPVFLLPLWGSFYWRRGLRRFVGGVVFSILVLVVTLVFTSNDLGMFFARLQQMLGFQLPGVAGLSGAWGYWNGYYRYPLIAVFAFLSISFVLWPAQKNLATLISCSAALMVGTQFWHAHSGGLSLAWYLPVLLLTVFRPNLEDRVAVAVVSAGWRSGGKRRAV